jgi:four helix bundle protein
MAGMLGSGWQDSVLSPHSFAPAEAASSCMLNKGGHGEERLRALGLAQEVAAEVVELLRQARIRLSLSDQTARAADSLVLNVAEGGSHYEPGLKLNNYRAARASAGELIAALRRIEADSPGAPVLPLIRKCHLIQKMLLQLIRKQELRRRERKPN